MDTERTKFGFSHGIPNQPALSAAYMLRVSALSLIFPAAFALTLLLSCC